MATARASRESVAYQDEIYRRVPAPKKQQKPLRAVKTRPNNRMLRIKQLACAMLVVAIAGVLIYSQMMLTQLTDQVASKQMQLDELSSEHVALKAKQDRALSLTYVEQYAQNSLGMVKIDNNQVEYVEMNNPDQIEVSNTGVSLRSAVSGLVKSFSAVLAYLE